MFLLSILSISTFISITFFKYLVKGIFLQKNFSLFHSFHLVSLLGDSQLCPEQLSEKWCMTFWFCITAMVDNYDGNMAIFLAIYLFFFFNFSRSSVSKIFFPCVKTKRWNFCFFKNFIYFLSLGVEKHILYLTSIPPIYLYFWGFF